MKAGILTGYDKKGLALEKVASGGSKGKTVLKISD